MVKKTLSTLAVYKRKMNLVFQRSSSSNSSGNSARRNSANANVSFTSTSSYSATPVTQHPAPTASLKPERPQRSRVVIPASTLSGSAVSVASTLPRWNENQPPLSASQLNFSSNTLQGNVTDDDITDDDNDDDGYDNDIYGITADVGMSRRVRQENKVEGQNKESVFKGRPLMASSNLFSSSITTTTSFSPRQSLRSSLAQAAEAANAAAASVVGAVANLNLRRGIHSAGESVRGGILSYGESASIVSTTQAPQTSFDLRPDEESRNSAFALLEQLGEEVVGGGKTSEAGFDSSQVLPPAENMAISKKESSNHDVVMKGSINGGELFSTRQSAPLSQPSPTLSSNSPPLKNVSPDAKALVSHLARVVQHQNHLEAELRATQKRLAEVERLNVTISDPPRSSPLPQPNSLQITPGTSLHIEQNSSLVDNLPKSSSLTNDDKSEGSLLTITDAPPSFSPPHSQLKISSDPLPSTTSFSSSSFSSSSSSTSLTTSGLFSVGGGMLRVNKSLASVALSPTGRTVSSHLQHRLHVTAQHLQRQLSELQTKFTIAANEAADREAALLRESQRREEEWQRELSHLMRNAREEGQKEGEEAFRLSSNLSQIEHDNEILRSNLKLAEENQSRLEREKTAVEEESKVSASMMQMELKESRNAISLLNIEIEHLQACLQGSKSRCAELEVLVDSTNQNQNQLQSLVDEHKREIQDLRSVLIAGNTELDDANNERDSLRKELVAMREQNCALQLANESSQQEYQSELARYRQQSEELTSTFDAFRREAAAKSDADFMALRKDDQETISELIGIVAALKTRRIETERLLAVSKERELMEKTRADNAEEQLHSLHVLSSNKENELKSLLDIHSKCETREGRIIEEYSEKVAAKDLEMSSQVAEIKTLSASVINLQNELEKATRESKLKSKEGTSMASQTSPLPAPGILSPRKVDEIKELETEATEGRLQRMAISAQLEAARDAHESALRDNDVLISKFNDERQSLQRKLDSLTAMPTIVKPNPAITAAAVASATNHLRQKLSEKNSALLQAVSAAEQAATAAEEAEKMEREIHNIIPLLRAAYETRLRSHGVPVPSDDEINDIISRGSTEIGLSNDNGSINGSPRSTISAPPTGISSASTRRSQRLDQIGDVSFRQLLGSTFGSLSHSIASSSFPSPLEASPSSHSTVNISDTTHSALLSRYERKHHSRSTDPDIHTGNPKPGFVSPETPSLTVNQKKPTPSSDARAILDQPPGGSASSASTGSEKARSLHFSPNSPIGSSSLESLAALPMAELTSPGQSSFSASTPYQSLEAVMMNALSQGLNAEETSKILQDALGIQSAISPSPPLTFQSRGAAAAKLGLRKGGISQLRSPE